MNRNRAFSNNCERSLYTTLCLVRIHPSTVNCIPAGNSAGVKNPWSNEERSRRERDVVWDGIHDYAMKRRTKHTDSPSSLVKLLYHQGVIGIPFSVSKKMCVWRSEGKGLERRKSSVGCLGKVLFLCLKLVLIRNRICAWVFRFKWLEVQVFSCTFHDIWHFERF